MIFALVLGLFLKKNNDIVIADKVDIKEASLSVDFQDIKKKKTLKININHATVQEIILLRGVGPALANRIIEFRKKNGLFKSKEALLNIKGIGNKKLKGFLSSIEL